MYWLYVTYMITLNSISIFTLIILALCSFMYYLYVTYKIIILSSSLFTLVTTKSVKKSFKTSSKWFNVLPWSYGFQKDIISRGFDNISGFEVKCNNSRLTRVTGTVESYSWTKPPQAWRVWPARSAGWGYSLFSFCTLYVYEDVCHKIFSPSSEQSLWYNIKLPKLKGRLVVRKMRIRMAAELPYVEYSWMF